MITRADYTCLYRVYRSSGRGCLEGACFKLKLAIKVAGQVICCCRLVLMLVCRQRAAGGGGRRGYNKLYWSPRGLRCSPQLGAAAAAAARWRHSNHLRLGETGGGFYPRVHLHQHPPPLNPSKYLPEQSNGVHDTSSSLDLVRTPGGRLLKSVWIFQLFFFPHHLPPIRATTAWKTYHLPLFSIHWYPKIEAIKIWL